MNGNNFIIKPLALIQDKRQDRRTQPTPLEQDYLCLMAQFEKAGGCTASNNYFADYFGVARQSAQGVIGRLKSKGFISCTEKKQGGETIERLIKIIDERSREILLHSRESLPEGSRKKPVEVAGNSGEGSRKPPTPTIETTTDTTTKNIYPPDSIAFKLANLLLQKILERKPDYEKPNLQKWAKVIDLMIRKGRKPENIEKVILWCQADCGNGNDWPGWQNNILSTATLREKFDKLEIAMQREQNANRKKLSADRRDYSKPVESSIAEPVQL